ncbi:hypothetical protein TNCV_1334641 [Trichonephila clavipes]|nr:hypothetical protein TNCV_1334641 [Trichonephila clavipes]
MLCSMGFKILFILYFESDNFVFFLHFVNFKSWQWQCTACQAPADLHSCPFEDSPPSVEQGAFGPGVLIARRTTKIEQVIFARSSQEASTIEETLNRPSASRELITELSSDSDPDQAETDSDPDEAETDSDQAETDEDQAEIDDEPDQAENGEKPNQSSPTSPTPECSVRSIRLSTRCYGSERTQNIHYRQ